MKPLLNQAKGALKNLMEDAQLFQALLTVAQENLPDELRNHLIGVSFDQQTMILQLDESIWATQLRFYEANLLSVFQEHFPHLELNRVKVNILPKPVEAPKQTREMIPPSETDAKVMLEISEHVESEGLKKALRSLSKRAQKTPN
jgi:hypothetical protein